MKHCLFKISELYSSKTIRTQNTKTDWEMFQTKRNQVEVSTNETIILDKKKHRYNKVYRLYYYIKISLDFHNCNMVI